MEADFLTDSFVEFRGYLEVDNAEKKVAKLLGDDPAP